MSKSDENDPNHLSPIENLRLFLAARRAEQRGECFGGTPWGGELRGPRRSEGYPQLVAEAMKYAWTWRGSALPKEEGR